MGSRTYETALDFEAKGFGWAYGDKPTFVLTRRKLPKTRDTVEFYSGDLAHLVNERLKPTFRSIWFVGGGAVSGECLRLGLADEVRYSIVPILIGEGIPFFDRARQGCRPAPRGGESVHERHGRASPRGAEVGSRRGVMKRIWTIIGVRDVARSVKWYQALFGQPESPPAHADFGQIAMPMARCLLCLHQWGAHEHPSLLSPHEGHAGQRASVVLRVDDFDLALPRARALVARLDEEPHVNPNTRTEEFSLRDPDGY